MMMAEVGSDFKKSEQPVMLPSDSGTGWRAPGHFPPEASLSHQPWPPRTPTRTPHASQMRKPRKRATANLLRALPSALLMASGEKESL